jgi:hypothetical protein
MRNFTKLYLHLRVVPHSQPHDDRDKAFLTAYLPTHCDAFQNFFMPEKNNSAQLNHDTILTMTTMMTDDVPIIKH